MLKQITDAMKIKDFLKSTGFSKNSSKREVHNNSGFHQETTTKIPNKQSNFIPKGTRKRINEAHS